MFFALQSLQRHFAADTEHTVGAGKGVSHAGLLRGDTVVILIIGLEVGGLQRQYAAGLVVEAETVAEAVGDERHIVHVLVCQTVACQLSAGRYGESVGDVPLGTCQIFVGVVVEQVLSVVVPVGLLVEEVVVAQVDAHLVDGTPHGTLLDEGAAPVFIGICTP